VSGQTERKPISLIKPEGFEKETPDFFSEQLFKALLLTSRGNSKNCFRSVGD